MDGYLMECAYACVVWGFLTRWWTSRSPVEREIIIISAPRPRAAEAPTSKMYGEATCCRVYPGQAGACSVFRMNAGVATRLAMVQRQCAEMREVWEGAPWFSDDASRTTRRAPEFYRKGVIRPSNHVQRRMQKKR